MIVGMIDINEKLSCKNCGWAGLAGETHKSLYVDIVYRTPPPVGDGYNLRCPKCMDKVKAVRYGPPHGYSEQNRKIKGH